MPDFLTYRLMASVMALGLAFPQAGSAAPPPDPSTAQQQDQPPAAQQGVAQSNPLWWQTAGDPTLAKFIERALAANPDLICNAISIRARQREADAAARRLGRRIERIFDADTRKADEAASSARAYRFANRRAHVAADVAAAYMEVRRLQEVHASRSELLEQFKDNAEIADFRRQAGLVTGIDSGLAGSLVSVSASDLEALRGEIDAAVRELARLTGTEPDAVKASLGDKGRVPDIAANVAGEVRLSLAHRADMLALESSLVADMTRQKVTQKDLDAVLAGNGAAVPAGSPAIPAVAKYREAQSKAYEDLKQRRQAVATAAARQAELEKSGRAAQATVKEARLAYRSGTGNFATLYVAEAAALSVAEARVKARAELARATIRLWTAEGGGWSQADLTLPEEGVDVAPELTVCE
ncbi:MAG TPA: TolC family protein [Novosphingobium sp.]|nr:TolC family protein [Novosphingobium sp.]